MGHTQCTEDTKIVQEGYDCAHVPQQVDGETGWDDENNCVDCPAGKRYHGTWGHNADVGAHNGLHSVITPTTSCINCIKGRYMDTAGVCAPCVPIPVTVHCVPCNCVPAVG